MVPLKKILLLLCAVAVLLPAIGVCNPTNAEIFSKEGADKEAKGDLAGAIEAYQSAYDNFSSNLRYGDGDPAVDPQAMMTALQKKLSELRRAYAQEVEKRGDFEMAAWKYREALGGKPDDVADCYDCARMYYLADDPTHALHFSTKAILMKPDFAEAYALRGRAKLRAVRLYNAMYIEGRLQGSSWEGMAGLEKEAQVKVDHVDLDGALDDLTKAAALKPGDAETLDCRGLVRYIKEDTQGAIADFTAAIAAKGDYAPAWSNRGHARLAAGDAKGAMGDLDKAIALDAGFAVAWGNRAAVKQAGGDLDGALADINKAIALMPDYQAAYGFRGILEQVKGDAAGALADFKKSGELEPVINAANWTLHYKDPALVKQAAGDMDGALSGLEMPQAAPAGDDKLREAFASAYFARAKARSTGFGDPNIETLDDLDRDLALELSNRGDERVTDLDMAIVLKPDYAAAYRARGLARTRGFYRINERGGFGGFEIDPLPDIPLNPAVDGPNAWKQRQKEDRDLAAADLDKAEKLNKGGDAETYHAQAEIKKEQGDGPEALADINKAMSLSPENAQYYGDRSGIEKMLGDEKASRADAMHGLDLGISQAKDNAKAAYAYFRRASEKKTRGDPAGALEDFTKSIEAWPEYSPAYTARAWLNYEHGNMKGVMDDLNKSISLVSDNASNSDAFYLRAEIERDSGDIGAALKDFEKSEALGSNDRDVWRDVALIDAGRKDYVSASFHFKKAMERWLSMMTQSNYDDDYKATYAGWLDGMQADVEKAGTFKGTKVEYLLNLVVGEYSAWPREGATDTYTRMIALRPGMGALHSIRGHLYYNLHSLPEALTDFRKVVALGNVPAPALDDARLFAWAARAQSGGEKGATEELQAWLDSGKGGPADEWHGQIARFLTGKESEGDLLDAAGKGTAAGESQDERKCDAYFYAGMKRLAAGDKMTALHYFNKSKEVPEEGHSEFNAATAELALLNPAAQ